MNLLVGAIRERAGELSTPGAGSDVSYGWLRDVLSTHERVAPLLRAAEGDPLISGVLDEAFAGVVGFEEWDSARALGRAEEADPRAYGEWVTMVPIADGASGITLPDDGLPDERISLFLRSGEAVRRMSVVVLPGEQPALELRIAGGECGRPYRGACTGGTCQSCRQKWFDFPDGPAGYICVCDDARSTEYA